MGNAFMSWRVESQLAGRKITIRKAGDPASIADLKPSAVPVADNAAAQIQLLRPQLEAFEKDQWQFLDKTELGKAWRQAEERGEAPTDEQAAAMRAILDKYAPLTAGIEQASACDAWASQVNYSLDHTQVS